MKGWIVALVALLATASPVLAQASPIHVTAETTGPAQVQPGQAQQVGCLVENTSGENVLVQIHGEVTYADGRTQTIFRPGEPILLGPDEGFILLITFAVPFDAALGTATFTCTVRAVTMGGGVFVESDTSGFEVVAG